MKWPVTSVKTHVKEIKTFVEKTIKEFQEARDKLDEDHAFKQILDEFEKGGTCIDHGRLGF